MCQCQCPSWHFYWPAALFSSSSDWLLVTVTRTWGTSWDPHGFSYAYPPSMDSSIILKARRTPCVRVCVCVCAQCTCVCSYELQDPCRHMSLSVSLLSFPPSCFLSIHHPSCFTAVWPHTLAICGYALEVLFAQIKVYNEWVFALSGPPCQVWQRVLRQKDTWAWKNNTCGFCDSCRCIRNYC